MLSDTEFKCAECPNGMRGNGIHCSPINEVCVAVIAEGMTVTHIHVMIIVMWFNRFFSVRKPILVHI